MRSGFTLKNYIFFAVLLIAFSLVAAFFFGLLPLKPLAVATGSMKPSINIGDAVVVCSCDAKDLNVGDIIAFSSENGTVVHRIERILEKNEERFFVTKGDDNNSEDSVPVGKEQIIGRVVLSVPKLGYPSLYIRKLL